VLHAGEVWNYVDKDLGQHEVSEPPSDAISGLQFSPYAPNKLLVSSWDKNVYLYDVADGSKLTTVEFEAALLDVCFGENDEEAFAGGLDCEVHRYSCSSSGGGAHTDYVDTESIYPMVQQRRYQHIRNPSNQ
jgi:WD40 repeat protein